MPYACLIQINKECNLKCSHCSQSAPYKKNKDFFYKLSLNDWSEVFSKLYSIGMPRIEFTGGDPFLRPDFKGIFLEAKKFMFNISVVTNGLLLKENMHWLCDNKPNKLRISLYGGGKESYEKATGIKGSYDNVISNIRLSVLNDLNPTVVILLNNCSCHEVESAVQYLQDIGVKVIRIIQAMSVGRFKKTKRKTLVDTPNQEQIGDILSCLVKKKDEIDFKISMKSNDESIFDQFGMSFDKVDCKVDLNYLWNISDSGDVYPCCLLMYENNGKIFNILDDDIKDWHEWTKNKIFSYLNTSNCNFCPAKIEVNDLCPLTYAGFSK